MLRIRFTFLFSLIPSQSCKKTIFTALPQSTKKPDKRLTFTTFSGTITFVREVVLNTSTTFSLIFFLSHKRTAVNRPTSISHGVHVFISIDTYIFLLFAVF